MLISLFYNFMSTQNMLWITEKKSWSTKIYFFVCLSSNRESKGRCKYQYQQQHWHRHRRCKDFLKKFKIYVQCNSIFFLALTYLTLVSRRYNYSFFFDLLFIYSYSRQNSFGNLPGKHLQWILFKVDLYAYLGVLCTQKKHLPWNQFPVQL